MGNSDTKLSTANILNRSYDATYDTLAVEGMETDGSSLKRPLSSQMAVKIDTTSTSNAVYIGKAPIGSSGASAVWLIKKIDTSSGVIITWAGSGQFNQVWNNRTGLTYA